MSIARGELKSLALVVIGLALVAVRLDAAGPGEEHIVVAPREVTLKDVCANRVVPIISTDAVKSMIYELHNSPDVCPESYRQSFYELDPILKADEIHHLCTEQKFDQIKEYHFRYINPLVDTYKLGDNLNNKLSQVIRQKPLELGKFDEGVQLDKFNQVINIPISLQHFFKAWALEVSGLCKSALIANLERGEKETMDEDDIQAINAIIKPNKAALNPITNEAIDFDYHGIVYLPELEGERKPGDLERLNRPTLLDLTNQPDENRFMQRCAPRFRPIYNSLIMPVVRLAKLGYNYIGDHVLELQASLKNDPLVRKWIAIAAICEGVGRNVKLVQPEEAEPNNVEPINYLPKIQFLISPNSMWIKGAEGLRKELSRIKGEKATGLKKLAYESGVVTRKVVAFLDPHRSAWYRRNQNTISSTLNFLSITSNMASIGVTVAAAGG